MRAGNGSSSGKLVAMDQPVQTLLRAATRIQRVFLGAVLIVWVGLIGCWIAGCWIPLEVHLTLHNRYSIRCENGILQWSVASYSRLLRFDVRTIAIKPMVLKVQAPVVETDARKLAVQYPIPRVLFRQWPCVQGARLYTRTTTPYVGRINKDGHVFAPGIMYVTTGAEVHVSATPCWLPTACVSVIALLVFWRIYARIPDALRAGGCCVACGYDLRMTPNRCPECGTVPVD